MSNNNKNGGVGFFSLLTVLFIGLKLTGYITWSWWWVLWVLSPLWASFAVAISFALFAFLIAILVAIIKSI